LIETSEKQGWNTTVKILVVFSLVFGLIQRTQYQILQPIFEICVVHIPTVFALIIYFNIKNVESPTDETVSTEI